MPARWQASAATISAPSELIVAGPVVAAAPGEVLVGCEPRHLALDDRGVGREVGLARLLGSHEREHVAEPVRVPQPEAPLAWESPVDPEKEVLGRAVAAGEAEVRRAETDLLAHEGVVVEPPAGEVGRLLLVDELAQRVPIVLGPERPGEQLGVGLVVGVDAVAVGGAPERAPEVELAGVEDRVGPSLAHGGGDRLRAVGHHPLGAGAVGVEARQEVEPRFGRLVAGHADPLGHHWEPGIIAPGRREDRPAPFLGIPAGNVQLGVVGPDVERLGIEDEDPGPALGREPFVDPGREQVEVTGGERERAARPPHPVVVLDVVVAFEPDGQAGSPERGPAPGELEQAGDLVGGVEVVGPGDRSEREAGAHVAGRALLAVGVGGRRLPPPDRERVRRRAVRG